MQQDDKFRPALEGKEIPLLTLDHKWYRLFSKAEADSDIKKLEAELNELIKRQGKINTENKDLRKIKAGLMNDIVSNMEAVEEGTKDKTAEKKVEESKRLINEINVKMEDYSDELKELPKKIKDVNYKLMLLTMEKCYGEISKNTVKIDEIGTWIKNIRKELKENVIRKQEMEYMNVEIYSYMHDIFGPEVIDIFDFKYDIEAKKQEFIARQNVMKEKKTE